MSYESGGVIYYLSNPGRDFVVTSVMQLRQYEKDEQAGLDRVLSAHKDDPGKYIY